MHLLLLFHLVEDIGGTKILVRCGEVAAGAAAERTSLVCVARASRHVAGTTKNSECNTKGNYRVYMSHQEQHNNPGCPPLGSRDPSWLASSSESSSSSSFFVGPRPKICERQWESEGSIAQDINDQSVTFLRGFVRFDERTGLAVLEIAIFAFSLLGSSFATRLAGRSSVAPRSLRT